MFSVGNKVQIINNSAYNKQFIGNIGIVSRIFMKPEGGLSIGVKFDCCQNSNSSDGTYWFSEDDICVYETQDDAIRNYCYNDAINTLNLAYGIQSYEFDKAFAIDKVIYSGPKTIILWHDGTKTMVSCSEDDHYDYYAGFCASVTQKVFGTNSQIKALLKNKL